MNSELVPKGLQELTAMIVGEVKKQTSNEIVSKISFKEAYDYELYRRKSKGHSESTLKNTFAANSSVIKATTALSVHSKTVKFSCS